MHRRKGLVRAHITKLHVEEAKPDRGLFIEGFELVQLLERRGIQGCRRYLSTAESRPHCFSVACRHATSIEPALSKCASKVTKDRLLGLALHTLGHDGHAQALTKPDDRRRDTPLGLILVDAAHEARINL